MLETESTEFLKRVKGLWKSVEGDLAATYFRQFKDVDLDPLIEVLSELKATGNHKFGLPKFDAIWSELEKAYPLRFKRRAKVQATQELPNDNNASYASILRRNWPSSIDRSDAYVLMAAYRGFFLKGLRFHFDRSGKPLPSLELYKSEYRKKVYMELAGHGYQYTKPDGTPDDNSPVKRISDWIDTNDKPGFQKVMDWLMDNDLQRQPETENKRIDVINLYESVG